MKKILKSHTASLLIRLGAIYIALFLIRIVFIIHNSDLLGHIELSEIPRLAEGSLRFDTANICYVFGLFILFSLMPLSPRTLDKKWYIKTSFILFVIGVIAVTVVNLSDSVYFHYARKRFSVEEFHFLNNSNTALIMLKGLWENLLLVALGIAIIWGLIYIFRITRPIKPRPRSMAIYYISKSILLIISACLIVVGIRGGIRRDTRPITMSNAAAYATTPAKASIVLSNPFCILRTMGNSKQEVIHFFEASVAAKYYSPLHFPVQDSTFGSQRGKNLVIIVLESFSAEHSKFLYPDLYEETLMPFMDSLMSVSYTFTNAYANGRKSIDALPSILSSIPSLGTPFATLPAALSPMDGLGNFFKEQGYDNTFYNGSPSGSMGYDAYARLAGIDNFLSMEDYEAARGKKDYDNYWGIWDGKFLDYFADDLNTTAQPFFATLFTLSSHHPFVVPQEYENSLPAGFTKIHKPVAYVDLSLREFMNKASTMPWYDNTVFLFVADHVSSETYSDYARTPRGNTHITYFIYTPDKSLHGINADITQQIDIKPTLFHLFGNEKPYHAFGRNVMSKDSEPFAVNFSSGMFQWITGNKEYLLTTEELKSDTTSSDEELNRMKAFLQSYTEAISSNNFKYQPEIIVK